MKNIILSIGLLFATALSTAQNVFQASGERSVLRTELPKYTKIDIDSRWEVTLVNEKNDHIYIDADNAIHILILMAKVPFKVPIIQFQSAKMAL